ncbi:MAG: MafI family immunity protein [Desulfobacteraceae bacterium]|nr:MafI family immunity protein [Desulfobacteraceae bacterium]
MTDFQYIEKLLVQLLELLKTVFIESERKEVQDLIDVGEYGVALETLVDIIDEENKKIPGEALWLIKNLAKAMHIDEGELDEKLRSRISDS